MKRLLISVIMIMLLVTACGKESNIQEDTTEIKENTTQVNVTKEDEVFEAMTAKDFIPVEKDVYLKFKGTGNEYAEYETYIDYIKDDTVQIRNINPGTTLISVLQYKDGELKRVFSQGETYFNFDYTTHKDKDEVLIKEPIEPGTSWQLKDGTTRSITAIDKEVAVPAGTYTTLEVTTVGSDFTMRDYYKKGIGLIKSEFVTNDDSDYSVVSELEKMERNVSQKKNINFYFPDFNNDRIIYEKRNIEIKTNQDVLSLLQEELKKAPKGDELKGTLTANANILGVKIDFEKGIVTVDFTNQLVSEMNAGTSYESMILKSIVNTFGDYFMVDKIIITLEGKPYSSGHILMDEGEYFSVTKESAIEVY